MVVRLFVMNKRHLKDMLYEQVARVGKAVSSPKRLELLELLAQGEKSVDQLAGEISADIKLTSAHLKALKAADVRDFIIKEGGDPVGSTPEELAAYFKREVDKYGKIIRAGNITVD